MNNDSRKYRIINSLVFVAVAVGILVFRYLPPTVAYWRSSEVYKRYSRVEGVRATYVKDFRVNDTLTIGVTLLEATDSAGWAYLVRAFDISQEKLSVFEQAGMDIFVWQALRDNPEKQAATKGDSRDTSLTCNDVVTCACSIKGNKICVFHTQSKDEMVAIDNYNYDKMIDKKNL